MRLAKVVVRVGFSSVANFNSFLLQCGQHGILNRHAMVIGCEVKVGDHICHALNDIVDEDIGGLLKPLESIKGHLNYFFFVLVHVICWLSRGWNPAGLVRCLCR